MAALLAAWMAAALATALATPHAHATACTKLSTLGMVSVHGRAAPLRVYWDGSSGRAAAALLAAALRHALCYEQVELRQASFCALAGSLAPLNHTLDQNVQEVALMPTAAWGAAEAACAAGAPDAAAARLRALGPAAAPLRLRLRLLHAEELVSPFCLNTTRWLFYMNESTLINCGFHTNFTAELMDYYYPEEQEKTAMELRQLAASAGVRLRGAPLVSRRALLAERRARPALLLDYDVWPDLPHAPLVLPPPGAALLAPPAVRAADENILRTVAPQILRLFNVFKPTPQDLKEVFYSKSDLEEAAYDWAKNSSKLTLWTEYALNGIEDIYEVAVFLCKDDPNYTEYKNAGNKIMSTMLDIIMPGINLFLRYFKVDCDDEHALMRKFLQQIQSAYWPRLVGALGAGAGARVAAGVARALDTALVVYDTPEAPLASAAQPSSGTRGHLARALSDFVIGLGWSRLAVLSDDTKLAAGLVTDLQGFGILKLKKIHVNLTDLALKEVVATRSRVLFVNTNASTARSILCGAYDAGMTASAGYVWILREWHAEYACANASVAGRRRAHFTVSFWRRGDACGAGGCSGAAQALAGLWPGRAWPLHAAPFTDALMLLLHSFQNFLKKHPHRRTDLHGENATGLLWENIEKMSIHGVTQKIELNRQGLINPVVLVDQWHGHERENVVSWQVHNRTMYDECLIKLRKKIMDTFGGKIPSDGTISCVTKPAGDEFAPTCYDGVIWTLVTCAVLAMPALYAAQRARRARVERRDQQRAAGLLARGERAAAALAPHLVDRLHLDLRDELGCGRFGRVRFAILRKPGRSAIAVAVKALRDDVSPAEEREFLNEACVLASLAHANVVRLIGVCAVGGPPLLLMEHAFFGDLHRYLSERRHLAGQPDSAEARHVAAPALTRLGSEAAAALEYLAEQRVVHRDVRASNCLVDARRTLKLADFGMARRADVGATGEAEYACRRRGLFPVLWMAPESLERGVFTAASDAWALGVLLLELVTLGARPYGTWPPLRVMRYVTAGGCPPLPADIDPDTREVVSQCWRAAEERASAAAVRAQLAAHPALLRPARDPPALKDLRPPCDL